MKIALIQQKASPDRKANRERGLDAVGKAAAQGAQVICFAELAFDPFYPQEEATPKELALAEPVPGPTTEPFSALAAKLGVVLILNVFEREGDRTFDTSPVIDAGGRLLGSTRMVHITDYPCFHEQGYYAPGDHGTPVYQTAFGRIGVAICYDRHYPEYMRALALRGSRGRGGPPGGSRRRMAGGSLRGRDAGRRLPERVLHGSLQSGSAPSLVSPLPANPSSAIRPAGSSPGQDKEPRRSFSVTWTSIESPTRTRAGSFSVTEGQSCTPIGCLEPPDH